MAASETASGEAEGARIEDAWHYPWGDQEFNKTARFLTSLSNSKLETTKCKSCSAIQWPPRSICSKCLSLDLEWVELPKSGTLVAFTRSFIGGTHQEKLPMAVGAIHLRNGLRLLGRIRVEDFGSLKAGMPVEFASAKLVDGKPYWEFTPAAKRRR